MPRAVAIAMALSLVGMARADDPRKGAADGGPPPAPGTTTKGTASGKAPGKAASGRGTSDGGTAPAKVAKPDANEQQEKPCEETKPCAIE